MNPGKSMLSTASMKVDPALVALFDSSARPIQGPPKHRYSRASAVDTNSTDSEALPNEGDSESTTSSQEVRGRVGGASAIHGSIAQEDQDVGERSQSEASSDEDRPRIHKRKREDHDATDALEAEYLARTSKSQKLSDGQIQEDSDGSEASFGRASSEPEPTLVHESLEQDPLEKASRTVFLSNVNTEAITSRAAKKTLLSHLSSALDKLASPTQSIVSLRFRSIPVSSTSIPKRAAYIKKAVMDATTKSTNAYAVYSTTAAARLAVSRLNATIVLGRHLRVDSVAHPSPIDHRRCVFVGNLGFVDDESLLKVNVTEDGKEQVEKRKRTKSPMDVEEGLWRVFGERAGKVESVRVVRDSKTRVGKGFAYVQFYDANSVEAALLLSGQKFPPQLPRLLRVSRCKAPHKTARAVEHAQSKKLASSARSTEVSGSTRTPAAKDPSFAGRTAKLFGMSAASRGQAGTKRDNRRVRTRRGEMPGTDGTVARLHGSTAFEGQRASTKDRKRNYKPSDRKKFKKSTQGQKK